MKFSELANGTEFYFLFQESGSYEYVNWQKVEAGRYKKLNNYQIATVSDRVGDSISDGQI